MKPIISVILCSFYFVSIPVIPEESKSEMEWKRDYFSQLAECSVVFYMKHKIWKTVGNDQVANDFLGMSIFTKQMAIIVAEDIYSKNDVEKITEEKITTFTSIFIALYSIDESGEFLENYVDTCMNVTNELFGNEK